MRSYRFTSLLFYTLVMLAVAHTAAADTLTVHWDPSPDPDATGYYLYIGTTPGTYTYRLDVGGATSYVFTSAVAGTAYYFSASSYNASGVEGYPTSEVTGFSNAPPVLTNPGTQSSAPGVAVRLQLLGSDPYGEPVSYKATGLPAGVTVSASTGLITGTPSTIGSYLVTATVSDGLLSASQAFAWAVGSNAKPTLTQPANQTTTGGVAARLQLVATDPEGKPVTYGSTVLPAGLTLTTTTGLISGTPTTAGTTSVTVTASDGALSDSKTFTWTVSSTSTNKPPTLANPGDQSSTLGVAVKLQLSGSDPEGKPLTYSAAGLPAGVTFGATTGAIAGTPTTAGTFTVTAAAKDGVLTSSPVYFKWVVGSSNKAPVITNPGSKSSVIGMALQFKVAATDPEGKALSFKASNLPSGVSINATTGIISGTPGATGSATVTVYASDGVATSSASFPWAITGDKTAPVVTIASSKVDATLKKVTLTGTATDNAAVKQVIWSSSKGGSALVSGTATWSASVPLVTGTNVITISAKDGAGNVGTRQISIAF